MYENLIFQKVADRQVLAVWGFIIFRQQEGMHRLRVSLRETKTPSKNTKISPKNLGRFAGIIEE